MIGITDTGASLKRMALALNFCRARSFALIATCGLLVPLLAGCASQGPLRPPSLQLPNLAESPVAQRVGDHAELAWTTPGTTTDGERIKGAIIANVCLEERPGAPVATVPVVTKTAKRGRKTTQLVPAGPMPACASVQHLAVAPGPTKTTLELAPALRTGPAKLVAYRVELSNANGRSAGQSKPVYAAAGAAPAAVEALKVVPRRGSAAVEWNADSEAAVVELHRTLIATAAGPVSDLPKVKQARVGLPFSQPAKDPPREVTLRSESPVATDAGGMLDTGVRDGDTYRYVAHRVRTVTLNGQRLELHSVPSAAITFTFHDVFPPKAPSGLVLVPGGGFGESPSIDLSWDANLDNDIAGYNVYRSESGAFVKINAETVAAPAFRDVHVEPGHTYSYRVTAVDQRRNESAPSVSVNESLRR